MTNAEVKRVFISYSWTVKDRVKKLDSIQSNFLEMYFSCWRLYSYGIIHKGAI